MPGVPARRRPLPRLPGEGPGTAAGESAAFDRLCREVPLARPDGPAALARAAAFAEALRGRPLSDGERRYLDRLDAVVRACDGEGD